MSKFPRAGDYVRFDKKFTVNLGDLGQGPVYIDLPAGTLCEVLDTYIPKDDRAFMVDYVPFHIYLGVADKNIAPTKLVIRYNYIQHQEFLTIIPGGNPKSVEILFGKDED